VSSQQRQTRGATRLDQLDKMVLVVVRQGRLDCLSSSQRKPMKAKSQGGPPVLSPPW
jgi:hypothetical protein